MDSWSTKTASKDGNTDDLCVQCQRKRRANAHLQLAGGCQRRLTEASENLAPSLGTPRRDAYWRDGQNLCTVRLRCTSRSLFFKWGAQIEAGELSPAIVKLFASDLTILSSWQVPQAQLYGDPDFGSTPTLFTAIINGVRRELTGAINKNGIFCAWDRSNLAAGPVWQTRIGDPAGGPSSIVSASWDGSQLYVGGGNAIINGTNCCQNISALNPSTGEFIWRACIQGSMTSGITEVPRVLVMGYGVSGTFVFLNPSNGATLYTAYPAAAVEGETTVYNGDVYVSLTNGNLIALGP